MTKNCKNQEVISSSVIAHMLRDLNSSTSLKRDRVTWAVTSRGAVASSGTKAAFTLAEVLITLANGGVVAALTIPTLIENHNKQVVETRLKKFYSSMNQAINMAKVEYGDVNTWWEDIYGTGQREAQHEFFMSHLGKHLNIVKYEDGYHTLHPTRFYILSDGSSFAWGQSDANGRDWLFYPGNYKKCIVNNNNHYRNFVGRCAFAFMFTNDTGFRTFDSGWNGDVEKLYTHTNFGCGADGSWNAYCTRLIQVNSWKIPDDYPFKVRYR